MLYVLCRIGRDSYAIPGGAVERVLPFAYFKSLPGADRGVVGLLNYQGTAVPIVDLCLLLQGTPASEVLTTRILLLKLDTVPSRRLGILVEGVSEAANLRDEDFREAGVKGDECLDEVIPQNGHLIQRFDIRKILSPEIIASLNLTAEFSS